MCQRSSYPWLKSRGPIEASSEENCAMFFLSPYPWLKSRGPIEARQEMELAEELEGMKGGAIETPPIFVSLDVLVGGERPTAPARLINP